MTTHEKTIRLARLIGLDYKTDGTRVTATRAVARADGSVEWRWYPWRPYECEADLEPIRTWLAKEHPGWWFRWPVDSPAEYCDAVLAAFDKPPEPTVCHIGVDMAAPGTESFSVQYEPTAIEADPGRWRGPFPCEPELAEHHEAMRNEWRERVEKAMEAIIDTAIETQKEPEQSEAVPEWQAIGLAIDCACDLLPNDWRIDIQLMSDSGTVQLIDPDGNEHHYPCNYERFSDEINDAVQYAREQAAAEPEPTERSTDLRGPACVVRGSVLSGFTFRGPFATVEAAAVWCESVDQEPSTVVLLEPPEPTDMAEHHEACRNEWRERAEAECGKLRTSYNRMVEALAATDDSCRKLRERAETAEAECNAARALAERHTERIERLKTRLHEQTNQTQITATQITEQVCDVLRRYDVLPESLGHPVEQIVGQVVCNLTAERVRLHERLAQLAGEIAAGDTSGEIERLKSQLADVQNATKAAVDERCDASEKHCSCVPLLRAEVKRLQGDIAFFQGALERAKVTVNDAIGRAEKAEAKYERLTAEMQHLLEDAAFARRYSDAAHYSQNWLASCCHRLRRALGKGDVTTAAERGKS